MSVTPTDSVEPGYATTEFWLTIIGCVVTLIQPIVHIGLNAEQASALATLLVAIYTIARNYRKKS